MSGGEVFGVALNIEVLGGVFAGLLILVLFAILFGYGNAQYRAGYLKGDADAEWSAAEMQTQTGVAEAEPPAPRFNPNKVLLDLAMREIGRVEKKGAIARWNTYRMQGCRQGWCALTHGLQSHTEELAVINGWINGAQPEDQDPEPPGTLWDAVFWVVGLRMGFAAAWLLHPSPGWRMSLAKSWDYPIRQLIYDTLAMAPPLQPPRFHKGGGSKRGPGGPGPRPGRVKTYKPMPG